MATAEGRIGRVPAWILGLGPVAILIALIAMFVALDPIGSLRGVPPVESVAVERTVFASGEITLELRNDGTDPVEIAQVLVNDAYWNHAIDQRRLDRLETTTMTIPYPWEDGMPVAIALVTSTGVTIEHEVEAASLTPEADSRTILIYASLGLYIGVIPVAIGLLWWPALRRASKRWLGFFLAFTVGLLAFLLIDTVAEGFELATATAGPLDGLSLFAMGAIGAVLLLSVLETALGRRRQDASLSGLLLAYLIAAGIGLHNLGEGLAVGAALATGEVALGTFLVLGFAVHNTTEGLAIVSPLGRAAKRPSLWHFVGLGALAGAPTILGAWAGGFAFKAAWGALAFGVAAGAIVQVVWVIGRGMDRGKGLSTPHGAMGLMLGLTVMYITGLFTA